MAKERSSQPGYALASASCLAVFWWISARLTENSAEPHHPRLWLAIGVYFGFVLISPRGYWGALALATLASDLVRLGSSFGWPPLIGWASDTIAVLSVAALYRRTITGQSETALSLVGWQGRRLLLFGGVLVPAISTALFSLGSHVVRMPDMLPSLLHFSACALGILTMLPCVLATHELYRAGWRQMRPVQLAKDVLCLAGVAAVTLLSFSAYLPSPMRMPYLVYPVLVWVALRGRIGLTAVANLLVAVLMLYAAAARPSLAFSFSTIDAVVHLQLLIGITIFTHMVLTIVVAERRSASETIKRQAREVSLANQAIADENTRRRAAEEAAADANRVKSQFLASMSHEIRSPLGAMLGFVDLILMGDGISAEKRRYAEVIQRNGRHVRDLIDQILDLAKVEAGHLDINRKPVDLRELIDDVMSLMRIKADEKSLHLTAFVSDQTPSRVVTDALRLKQILINALGNALKFTDRGHVKLTVDATLTPSGDWLCECLVEDTGIGLDEHEQKRLFQAFSQADKAIASKYGGTGLGLVLSRHLARLLGGDFALVQSQKSVGSIFRLTICGGSMAELASVVPPPRPAGAQLDAHFRALSVAKIKVLVADDSTDSRLLTCRLLELSGAVVHEADNGQIAIERALANSYDLILMDLQMPDVGGLEAMLELKERGYPRPIIAVTGHAMPDEVAACLRAGFDGHLAKPFDRQMLLDTVRAFAAFDVALDQSIRGEMPPKGGDGRTASRDRDSRQLHR